MSTFRVKNLEVTGSFLVNGSVFDGGGGGVDLSSYATINYVSSNYALSSSLSNYVTSSSLSTTLGSYATTSSLTSTFLTGRIGAGVYAAYGSVGGGLVSTAPISGGNADGLSNEIGSFAALNRFASSGAYNYFGYGASKNYFGDHASNNHFGEYTISNNYFGSNSSSRNFFGGAYINEFGGVADPQTASSTNYINKFGSGSLNNRYFSGSGLGQFDFDTRPRVNGSGVLLNGEVLTDLNTSLYVTTGNNIFIYAQVEQLSPTIAGTPFTGSTYLQANNISIGKWLFRTQEMYSGVSATVGCRSRITGSGITYFTHGSIEVAVSSSASTAANKAVSLTTTTGIYNLGGVSSTISREGIMNVTGVNSKFQIAFAQIAANATASKLLSGSYIKLEKIL